MKKFKKVLLYDFSENKRLTEKLYNYTDEIKLVTANDDYQDVLNKEDFDGVDCFITNLFDNFHNNFFENSSVKTIFTMFTDVSMFDRKFLKEKGIEMHNVTGQASEGVAEFAVSVLLNHTRKTAKSERFCREGGEGFFDFKGGEICKKKIGIVGYGNIGKHFEQIMLGFGAIVNYYSKSSQTQSLNEIFQESDIIFISHPMDDGNIDLYGKELLQKCKKGAYILNPSRVEKFNLEELFGFLSSRPDITFWQDEAMNDIWKKWKEKFVRLENFLITPGCAFFTHEQPERVEELLLKNIENYES